MRVTKWTESDIERMKTSTELNEAGQFKGCWYHLTRKQWEALDIHWLSQYDAPKVGDRVRIRFNRLGTGTVESYFCEEGFAGLCVVLDEDPDWHKRQYAGSDFEGKALVFGSEIRPIEEEI